MNTNPYPTWDDTIQRLFSAPYWIDESRRAKVAADWLQCMQGYDVSLDQYESVRQWAATIYDHLCSHSMPLTTDETQFWPDAALAELRLWINQGCRHNADEPVQDLHIIPTAPQPARCRIRKNILDLSEAELNDYRARLEEVGATTVDPNTPWQQVAYLHTDWCLHYQEAFLLWHRANLRYFEELIDFPIPYWNFMSPNATKVGDPEAGLPQPFKDLTYTHPKTGEVRPNPLRFAVAKDGRSKACAGNGASSGEDCRYVQRDPVLYTAGDDHRQERQNKLDLLEKFQAQVTYAKQWPRFSSPEGFPGYPWANIQSFNPPPPDSDYPHKCDFDGLLEQPHDNFHGWVGPDMADNAYTAFDPMFWSLHSNIDRVFEEWKRAHPAAMFTATFPLRPFVGPLATAVSQDDPNAYIYTTIGDMAKDSRFLGYDFEPPCVPDAAGTTYNQWSDYLYVVFNNVRCIRDSYTVDVFLNLPNPSPDDMHNENQVHYVGRMTRLGMGVKDDKGRCVKDGVTRILDASYNAYYLHLTPQSEVTVNLIVTDVSTHQQVPPAEYEKLPGFVPVHVWSSGAQVQGGQQPSVSTPTLSCH